MENDAAHRHGGAALKYTNCKRGNRYYDEGLDYQPLRHPAVDGEGWCRHYYFSKFLRERGHQVRIFTASEIHNTNINMIRDGALYREETMDGVPYTFLKTRDYSGNGLSRIINMLEFPLRIQQAVNRFAKVGERPDVIYTSAPTIFAAASAVIAAKRLKVPCVVEVRDIWPESIVEYKGMSRKNPVILALYALEKWLYKNADRLIFTMEGGPGLHQGKALGKQNPACQDRQPQQRRRPCRV